MKLLLDTHVFLWYINADSQLPAGIRDAIRDPANDVYLSVAAVWEAVIKHALGKLAFPRPPSVYLPLQRVSHRIRTLPIEEADLAVLAALPSLHRDPFDRIMVSQAIRHSMHLATVDADLQAYPVMQLTS